MNDYNFTDTVGYRNDLKYTKLKDFISHQTLDSDQETHEYPDLDFIYSDTDTLGNEVAELYSYSEQPEFQLNVKAFEDYMEILKLKPCWRLLNDAEKSNVIVTLLDQLDVLDKNVRLKCARCFLYLLQGCWVECQSDIEQQTQTKENVILLYKHGVFNAFVQLFYSEVDTCSVTIQRKVSVNINDSTELRIILSILYIFIEIIRSIENDEDDKNLAIKEDCHNEISNLIEDELLTIKLFSMVTRFCGGSAPHYPIKKVLLLIWKLILFSVGGSESLKAMKTEKRKDFGLEPFKEDTIEIIRTMRASSPPSGGADGHDQNQKRTNRQLRRSLIKQSPLDESLNMDHEDPMMDEEDYDEEVNKNDANDENNDNSNESNNFNDESNNNETSISEASITLPEEPLTRLKSTEKAVLPQHKGLPWVPKIRQKDLDVFLNQVRLKYVGFTLPNDKETFIGLPPSIHESVKVLQRYVYVSLSDIQMEREENICKYLISQKEENIPITPAEILYQEMLPNMQQTIIALLKVLLAATPTSKTKTDSMNIMADVLPEEMPTTVLQSMKLETDVNRHKEIIVKAVSGILLLLLKHFKLNHVYQFEFLSQYLVFANCIPLILKFFNQNINAYVCAKNAIPILDFPSCVLGDQPELTPECLEIGDNQQFSWRNVFSCINLLRVLNKVTKWKHSRIMMLVVFKSAPILKRTLKVRHPMMQLYILKLLKMQTKYLGRQWRKSNMKIMSAIYQKVRHRLNDDWAYGNDIDARPWDFQDEECALRSSVDKFNNRRYFSQNYDPDFYPVDVDIASVLSTDVDLTEEFKKYYHLWVQPEVFDKTINWDEILNQDSL